MAVSGVFYLYKVECNNRINILYKLTLSNKVLTKTYVKFKKGMFRLQEQIMQ